MSKILRDVPIQKQIKKHMQRWELRRAESERQSQSSLQPVAKKLGPYISISRELGSNGVDIAHRLAERMGWQLFDREIIEAIAQQTHVREELVARFDEHVRSAWETYIQNLFTGQTFDNTHYLYRLSQVVLGIAQYGHAIILGHGAHYILPAEAGLRVLIVAPREKRLSRWTTQSGHEPRRAAQELEEFDKEQRALIQRYFRREFTEPSLYDAIINTAYLGIEAVVDLLIQLARLKLQMSLARL
jgi:cytidylate kinase